MDARKQLVLDPTSLPHLHSAQQNAYEAERVLVVRKLLKTCAAQSFKSGKQRTGVSAVFWTSRPQHVGERMTSRYFIRSRDPSIRS